MAKDNFQMQEVLELPVVPLRGVLAFPSTVLSFDVGRNRSVNAVERAAGGDKLLFVFGGSQGARHINTAITAGDMVVAGLFQS